MITLLRNFWLNNFNQTERRRILEERLEETDNKFNALLLEDKKLEEENSKNGVKNYLSYVAKEEHKNISPTECCKRVGTVTHISSNHGYIDETVLFDLKAAEPFVSDIKEGVRVNYLLYKCPRTEHLKVIKIESANENYWDDLDNTEVYKNESNDKKEEPEYFEISQRNILGTVLKQRDKNVFKVETEHKTIDVDLDAVKCDFQPQEGDKVYLCCKIQNDTDYVDRQGEILEVLVMFPTRTLSNEKCTVRSVHENWAVLNDDVLLTYDIGGAKLGGSGTLNVGDVVIAEIIECERRNFNWRCISYYVSKRSLTTENNGRVPSKQNTNHVVQVSPDQQCIFSGLDQQQTVEFTLSNQAGVPMNARGIIFPRRVNNLINLLDKTLEKGFEIPARGEIKIVFEVTSKFFGQSCEAFFIEFGSFRVKRSISLNVCEDAVTAELMRANNLHNMESRMSRNSRSRFYANKVWSKTSEVVPGVGLYAKRRFVARHIPGYDVPTRLRNNYLTNERKERIIENIEAMYPFLREQLTFENYVQRFQLLLHLEEIEHFLNFRKYDRERASFRHEGEFLALNVEGLSERRPSLVIGDVVRAIDPFNESAPNYDGIIHKVMGDKVLLKFSSSFHGMYRNEDYRLEFFFSRFGFRKSHFATERIVKHLGEQFLFPKAVIERNGLQLDITLDSELEMHLNGKQLKWFNPKLNPVQKLAVFNILRGETYNMPYVIFGPPGTGKTVTIVETILQLLKHVNSSRLLVGTPSNSGANLIATRLIESGEVFPGDFVRLVSLNLIEQDLIPEHLMPYCATVDIGLDGSCKNEMTTTESGLKMRCQMKYLGTHRITIGTCATLGNYLQMNFPSNHFSHVLVDEAGQCTEPETMIALTQVTRARGQVVLAGDPKQLQPVVVNRYAADCGLGMSFLERIVQCKPYRKDRSRFPDSCGYDSRLVTKLLYNYRALPSILKVYDSFFYDSELLPVIDPQNSKEANMLKQLTPAVLSASEKRPPAYGTFFHGVRSENMQDKDSPSWYNMLEARNVFLYTIKLYRQNISSQNIGIITPYSRQVKYLRNMFITASVEVPKIGTVEEFQGQERDIIIISTVRSSGAQIANDLKHALGFVRCEKRMNVAISRARYLQIVFGNPHLLCIDPYWQRFIEYCIQNDAYEGCDLPESFNVDCLNGLNAS